MSGHRIGELARRTGVKVETIRFYETEGLLPPPVRSASNYRVFEQAHLDRLSFIKRARDLGFTLDQVRQLLRLADDPLGSCGEVDAMTSAHVAEIDLKLKDLRALRAELVRRLDCCDGASIADCSIIGALSVPRGDAMN